MKQLYASLAAEVSPAFMPTEGFNSPLSFSQHQNLSPQVMIAAVVFSSELQRVSSPEQEEGIIPDSPVLHSSLPVANKLRKHRHFHSSKHVRYAETHPRKPSKSLFSGQSASL